MLERLIIKSLPTSMILDEINNLLANSLSLWEKVPTTEGFILEKSLSFIAIKSTISCPWLHYAWVKDPSKQCLKKIENFYGELPYGLVLPADHSTPLIPNSIKTKKIEVSELLLSRINYISTTPNLPQKSTLTIKSSNSPNFIATWSKIASENFQMPYRGLHQWAQTINQFATKDLVFLIAYQNENPCGTLLLNKSSGNIGAYFLSVLPKHRKKGIGRALILEAAKIAKKENLDIVLYAEKKLTSFYINQGFYEQSQYTEYLSWI